MNDNEWLNNLDKEELILLTSEIIEILNKRYEYYNQANCLSDISDTINAWR